MKEIPFKRLLILSPSFAPFANAEAIVNNKLAMCFLENGVDVEIISKNLIGESDYDYGSSWEEIWMPLKQHTHSTDYGKDYFDRVAETFKSLILYRNLIAGNRWAFHAYRKASKLHSKKPFDLVLSRAFPLSAHLPALKLKTRYKIPWIANWNDPWEFLRDKNKQAFSLSKGIGKRESLVANSIAEAADWHTFPSEQLKRVMTSLFNFHIDEVSSVVPHIVLPKFQKNNVASSGETYVISYLGRLSRHQDPTELFKAIAGLIRLGYRILVKFYGIYDLNLKDLASATEIADSVSVNPPVHYYDSLKVMSDSDLLLIIDPEDLEGIILTSKVADYIQAEKPILALTNSNGTLARLFTHRHGVYAVPADQKEIGRILTNLIQEKNSGIEITIDPILKSYFSPEHIMDLYSEIYSRIRHMHPE